MFVSVLFQKTPTLLTVQNWPSIGMSSANYIENCRSFSATKILHCVSKTHQLYNGIKSVRWGYRSGSPTTDFIMV